MVKYLMVRSAGSANSRVCIYQEGHCNTKTTTDDDDGCNTHCAAAEDCIGKPTARLVQGFKGGERVDVYCIKCWSAIRSVRPDLVHEDLYFKRRAIWTNVDGN